MRCNGSLACHECANLVIVSTIRLGFGEEDWGDMSYDPHAALFIAITAVPILGWIVAMVHLWNLPPASGAPDQLRDTDA